MGVLDIPGISVAGLKNNPQQRGAAADAAGMRLGYCSALVSKLAAGRENASIVVFSDSTGDETLVEIKGRWVRKMAERLAARYPAYTVNLRHWNTSSVNYDALGVGQSRVIQVGNGTSNAGGPFVLDVYCGAATGTNPNYAYSTVNWPTLAPSSISPDVAFVNYGHNLTGTGPAQQRVETFRVVRQIKARYPAASIVLVAQNPRATSDPEFLADMLRARMVVKLAADLRCGLVNVLQAYLARSDYETALLVPDGLHPSVDGSNLWADETMKLFQSVGVTDTQPLMSGTDSDMIWLPASDFNLHTGTPTLGLVNGTWTGWAFPSGQLSAVEATVLIPRHWAEWDTYVHYALPNASGYDNTTVVAWRIHRGQQSNGLDLPGNRFAYAPPAMGSASIVTTVPSNGTAFQTQIGVLATQSPNVNGLMGLRVTRETTNDTIAQTCFFRGLLLQRAS